MARPVTRWPQRADFWYATSLASTVDKPFRRCCRKGSTSSVTCAPSRISLVDDAANGHFDLSIGAIVSTLLDHRIHFNAWYAPGSAELFVLDNSEFQCPSDEIDREVDPASGGHWCGRPKPSWKQTAGAAGGVENTTWYDYVKAQPL